MLKHFINTNTNRKICIFPKNPLFLYVWLKLIILHFLWSIQILITGHGSYRPIRCLDFDVSRIRGTWLANRGRKYPKCTKRGTKSRERGKKILRYIEIDFSFKFEYRFGKICYAYRFAADFGGSFALGSAMILQIFILFYFLTNSHMVFQARHLSLSGRRVEFSKMSD